LRGAPLPPGWLGKSWACHQLASAASGDVLLFTDADTQHHPQALSAAVSVLERDRLGFLSVLPEQTLGSWGERLIVPMLAWSQQTFYPIALFRRIGHPALTTAVGQYMLFRRSAYEAVGGFERVKGSVLDDCDLVRAVAKARLGWTLLDGTGRVTTRMYSSFRDATRGFSKNLFARFRYNLLGFAFVWMWLLWVTWQPPILLAVWACAPGRVPDAAALYAGAATATSFLLWLTSDARFRVRLDHALYAPLTVLLTFAIAIRSVVWRLLGRGTWKGRPLPPRAGLGEP
jgi:chlorobactene glucosyltransferase